MSKFKKVLISIFVLLNITTILYSNRPSFVDSIGNKILDEHFSKVAAYNIRYLTWKITSKIQMYAYLVGLGNHWIMFGYQNHFNWWYRIKAKYADSSKVLLPLARQSKRTFWQWLLFDFKEAKIQHNMYSEPNARKAYAHYLCKQFPKHRNSPIRYIVWEIYWQNILEPKEASEVRYYLAPQVYSSILNNFRCPTAGKQ